MTAVSSFINVWKQLKINERDESLQLALRECSYFFSRFFFLKMYSKKNREKFDYN